MPARKGPSTVALVLVACAVALAADAAPAEAGRHKVRAGQTLAAIAARYECSLTALRRANRLRGDRIIVGQVLTVPACAKRVAGRAARSHDASPPRRPQAPEPRRATPPPRGRAATRAAAVAPPPKGESVGKPWKGTLRGGLRLPQGKGYLIRRPLRSWGTPEMVATVRDVLRAVRADHRELHTLAIGDLSQRGGGRITEHRSHQSGRDIDVGFYYRVVPPGYPSTFAVGTADNLDLGATWDLLRGFARTADDANGVSAIFLDYDVQGLLYEWAKGKGVDERYLDRLFQYPDGTAGTGLVRHEPHHADHLHVRFRCPLGDAGCE